MANSFKAMIKAGVIRRSDVGMFINIHDIHVRPGLNRRNDNARTRDADEKTYQYMLGGGKVPPLEVEPRDEGGVWVVEGHRRRAGYLRCLEAGKPVDRIHIVPFVGNDIERKARVMTSNNQLSLSPVEQAAVVKDLAAFNLTPAEIANYVHKSVATVEKLLALSVADYAIQQSVDAGEISVDIALSRVEEYGSKAAEVLEQDKAKAAAAGKKKVTRSLIAPEISVKKARRAVELLALANITDDGVITLGGVALAELLAIIDEQLAINDKKEVAA